ncbi:MAG TPA: M20/M25/M40 family metallo-hydrolase [Gemmatimonadales bacterium]|jgi:acetylornithine deacetylase/succinyl-diaminopimelate desuccinylase-like protein|nr:M20/M25/M40 family metallo-hydrolase [Gemmatimonadales bacterium]
MPQLIDTLVAHERVRAARQHIERSDDVTLARQAALSAIPAPTGAEGPRATHVAELFRDAGLMNATTDEVGNVHAWYGDGDRAKGNGCVVLSAHLDTVFGAELDVSVARRGPRLEGPGISDNARGLAALITVAEALVRARVRTARPVLFAATVGEEGSGDLRGVKHLFTRDGLKPAAFIALDGAGLDRIVHRALGSRRYRVTYRGPGGHSWAAFGVANPANAVGRATALLADLPTHHAPRTTCAVVRLGGGTGLNSIPQEAWLDLDLRSEDPRALVQLDERVQAALARALDEENRRRTAGTPPLRLDLRRMGDRPSGVTPRAHPLVQVAIAATRALGRPPELACASTDANVPIALGVPAIALGAGGRAGDAHLPTEWYENNDGALGVVRALLVTAAMAEVV